MAKKKKAGERFALRFCFERLGVIWVWNIKIKGEVRETEDVTRTFGCKAIS